MAFNTTPSLGTDLDYVGAKPYYDGNFPVPSPKLGSVVKGDDGHDRVWVQASANIAANTAVIVTEPAFTAAGGAGAFSTSGTAVLNGQYFWARSNTLN